MFFAVVKEVSVGAYADIIHNFGLPFSFMVHGEDKRRNSFVVKVSYAMALY